MGDRDLHQLIVAAPAAADMGQLADVDTPAARAWLGGRIHATAPQPAHEAVMATTRTPPTQTLGRQQRTPAFRAVRWLVGAYLVLSILTVAAIITLSDIAPDLVTPQRGFAASSSPRPRS